MSNSVRDRMRKDQRYGYIYLLNLVIPIGFLSLFPAGQALVGGLLIALFAAVYLLTYRRQRERFVLILLQIAIMMGLMAYLNGAYIWMIFYPAACIAIFYERTQVIVLLSGMNLLLLVENYVLSLVHRYALSDWLMILAAMVAGVAACYGTIWQARTMRSREQLREANLEIERLTKVAERERISQDLHDVMGHELSMITLKSQLVAKLVDRDLERAKSEVQDIENAARQALTRVREYIAGMRQPDLEEEWADAVKLLRAAGIDCEARFGDIAPSVVKACIHSLAMCLREATTNLVRYSNATKCMLELWQDDDLLVLKVYDNGTGMEIKPKGVSEGGNGINGMRARVASVGGVLHLWSNGKQLGPAPSHSPISVADVSPWSTGVCLIIAVPCHQSVSQVEEGRA